MEHPELKIVLALPHPFQAKESSSDQCNEFICKLGSQGTVVTPLRKPKSANNIMLAQNMQV